ncbi:hypothetical protein TrST_g11463 [Triparma strigata]|uniref:Uncharacterized protein n=1 Tax=Triparma strigata TaxID=1606541 RepID=A0A9W7A5R3_9STRA|nr:hypothetical protein TrST_g11463 [Triparma strigata]
MHTHETASIFSTGTPTPSKIEEPEGNPKAVVMHGAFWNLLKENYHTSLDTHISILSTRRVRCVGVLIIFPIIWSTNRLSFFLIDEISPQNFRRGMIGMGADLIAELAVLVVFSKILATRFQVKLPNLMLSITQTIGKSTMFILVAGTSSYIASFMMYHYGGDASFKFEWFRVDDFADVCEERQSEGRSCYS